MAAPTLCSPGGEGAPTTVERDEGGRGEGRAGGEAELSWEVRLSLGEPLVLPGPMNPTLQLQPSAALASGGSTWRTSLSCPTSCPTHVILRVLHPNQHTPSRSVVLMSP